MLADGFDVGVDADDVDRAELVRHAFGAYGTDSQNYYGINDMAGNVWEWSDLSGASGSSRGLRGGAWVSLEDSLRSSARLDFGPSDEYDNFGFRVASVPEPSGLVLTLLIGAGLFWRRKR